MWGQGGLAHAALLVIKAAIVMRHLDLSGGGASASSITSCGLFSE